ncbi:hypothetical protein GQ53DRAFT_762076 [Thozetella sp. PMI_491]|nr:hypothetical protein GQ53DRAFT_762076 [Thozetella sp. PMI_491]
MPSGQREAEGSASAQPSRPRSAPDGSHSKEKAQKANRKHEKRSKAPGTKKYKKESHTTLGYIEEPPTSTDGPNSLSRWLEQDKADEPFYGVESFGEHNAAHVPDPTLNWCGSDDASITNDMLTGAGDGQWHVPAGADLDQQYHGWNTTQQ